MNELIYAILGLIFLVGVIYMIVTMYSKPCKGCSKPVNIKTQPRGDVLYGVPNFPL